MVFSLRHGVFLGAAFLPLISASAEVLEERHTNEIEAAVQLARFEKIGPVAAANASTP